MGPLLGGGGVFLGQTVKVKKYIEYNITNYLRSKCIQKKITGLTALLNRNVPQKNMLLCL